jgi:hypothetical protein
MPPEDDAGEGSPDWIVLGLTEGAGEEQAAPMATSRAASQVVKDLGR